MSIEWSLAALNGGWSLVLIAAAAATRDTSWLYGLAISAPVAFGFAAIAITDGRRAR